MHSARIWVCLIAICPVLCIQTIDLKFLLRSVYPLVELFTGKWGRFKRLGQYMCSTIKTIVDRERKELALAEQQPADQAAAASKPFNFVRQLLAASYPDGSPLTEADIVDNLLQTILAAKDTTAIVSSGTCQGSCYGE